MKLVQIKIPIISDTSVVKKIHEDPTIQRLYWNLWVSTNRHLNVKIFNVRF